MSKNELYAKLYETVARYHQEPTYYKKQIRLGQYVVNKFFPTEWTPCPEIFYEEDNKKALDAIEALIEEKAN